MKIAIIILNYNGKQDTLECLESLQKINTKKAKVETIVVDVASKDDSAKVIKQQFPSVTLLEAKTNIGFTGGNNLGMHQAIKNNVDFIMLLNNDTTVKSDFLNPLLKRLKTPKIGAVSPKIYFSKGREFHTQSYHKNELGKVFWYAGGHLDWKNMYGRHLGVNEFDHGQFDQAGETDFATGCCIILPTKIIKKVGLLDNKYFLYFEDVDWSLRIKKAGYSIWYEPKSIIWHKNAGATQGSGSPLHQYFQTRNRMLFGLKYAPLKTKLALIKESVKTLFSKSSPRRKAIVHYYIRRLGKGYL